MATMAQMRVAIANALSVIEDVQWSPYMLGSPTPPAGHVVPGSIAYDQAMHRGHDLHVFTVQAFVAYGLDQGAQATLDEFLAPAGSRSVKAALEADRTLGGVVQHTQVVSLDAYQLVSLQNNRQCLAATWTVQVRA